MSPEDNEPTVCRSFLPDKEVLLLAGVRIPEPPRVVHLAPAVAYVLIKLRIGRAAPATPFPTSKIMTPVFQAHTNASPSRMKVS